MHPAQTRSRWFAGAAALLLVLLAALWWSTRPTAPAEAPPEPRDARAATSRPLPRPAAQDLAPAPVDGGREAAVDAMGALARVEGRGHLRCAIGDVVSGPVTAKGLLRPRVAGGVLVAQVEAERGTAAVYAEVTSERTLVAVELPDGQLAFAPDEGGAAAEDDASLPRAHVTWTGATPGALGTCRVDPVEPVEFVVATADGGDSFGATTDGACAVMLARSSLPDGRFRVRGARGVPCEVRLLRSELDDDGANRVLDGSAWIEDPRPDAVYTVALSPIGGPDGTERADAEGKPADDAEPSPESVWEQALALEDLSPEARGLLERWQEDEFQQADDVGRGWQLLQDQLTAPAEP